MKYRKKPVVIEAIIWDGKEETLNKIIEWDTQQTFTLGMRECKIIIATLEGDMTGDKGDYIIQGVKGEIYPCKPDIFEATYEKVEEETKTENQLEIKWEKTAEGRNEK